MTQLFARLAVFATGACLASACSEDEASGPKGPALVWVLNINELNTQTARVATDANGGVLLTTLPQNRGNFGGDELGPEDEDQVQAVIAKYSANQVYAWGRALTGPTQATNAWRAAAHPSGDVVAVLAGGDTPIDVDGTNYAPPMVLRLDGSDGSVLWANSLAKPEEQLEVVDLDVTADGTILVGGTVRALVDELAQPLAEPGPGVPTALGLSSADGVEETRWDVDTNDRESRLHSLAAATDGVLMAWTRAGSDPTSPMTPRLTKRAWDGSLTFETSLEPQSEVTSLYVAAAADGSALVAGVAVFQSADSIEGTEGGVVVARLAPDSGDLLWQTRFGAAANQPTAAAVAPLAGDSVAVAGDFVGAMGVGRFGLTGGEVRAVYTASLSLEDGQVSWARYTGGTNPTTAQGVATDPANAVLVSGVFEKTVPNSDPLETYREPFVLKLRKD